MQFTLRFKGREMAHLDLGRNLFNKIKQELFLVSKVERDAKMEGKRMTLVLQPDHKNPATAPPAGTARTGSSLNIPRPAPPAAACAAGRTSGPGARGVSRSTAGRPRCSGCGRTRRDTARCDTASSRSTAQRPAGEAARGCIRALLAAVTGT